VHWERYNGSKSMRSHGFPIISGLVWAWGLKAQGALKSCVLASYATCGGACWGVQVVWGTLMGEVSCGSWSGAQTRQKTWCSHRLRIWEGGGGGGQKGSKTHFLSQNTTLECLVVSHFKGTPAGCTLMLSIRPATPKCEKNRWCSHYLGLL
jgi:hypothetical protein